MNWIFVAVVSYLLIALGVILDKFLLSSKRISHPVIYAFYSGILSFFTIFIFAPFGFHWVSLGNASGMIASGLFFFIGIFFLFYAIKKSEASRVVPLIGAIVPLCSLVIEGIIFGQHFSALEIFGIIILIFGGLLISFDLPIEIGKKKFFAGFSQTILAGIFLAVAYSGFNIYYKQDNFSNVFGWTRLGLTLGAFLLFLFPAWRKAILKSLFGFKKEKRKHAGTANLFFLNKILNGVGSALVNYAIAIGSVAAVNALVSVEYVFVFILALIFHGFLPHVFSEKIRLSDLLQKVMAIFVIGIGIALIMI